MYPALGYIGSTQLIAAEGICSIAYEITDDWQIESSSYTYPWDQTRTIFDTTICGEEIYFESEGRDLLETCRRLIQYLQLLRRHRQK